MTTPHRTPHTRRRAVATAFIVLAGLILTSGHAAATPRTETPAAAVAGDTLHSLGVAAPSTAHTPSLRTWWHMNAEANADVPVAAQNVRQSTFYTVKVASDTARATWYDSFTYLTIPRSGKGKPGYEDPADGGYHQDGAENVWENAEEIGGTNAHHTMSWTTFEYAAATWVDVHLATGESVQSIDDVQLRPRNLDFVRYLVNSSTVRILVPYSPTATDSRSSSRPNSPRWWGRIVTTGTLPPPSRTSPWAA